MNVVAADEFGTIVDGTPGDFGPTFTRGTAGTTGTAGGFANPGGFGEVRVNGGAQTWYGTTVTPTFVWRHNGPIWKMDAGAGWSRASLYTCNVDKGFFGASQARRTGVLVSFDDIFGSMRNINDQTEDSKIYGPHTPDYAKFRQRVDYGSAWTFGIRGTF